MPRRKEDGPIISRLTSRNRSDGKPRYETSIPIPVAEEKGKWVITISPDNIITWISWENYLEEIRQKKKAQTQ